MSKKIDLKFLVIYSWPSFLAGLLEPLASLVDTALLGNLSTPSLAALSATSIVLSSFVWIFNFLVHAGTSTISYSVGQNKPQDVVAKIQSSMVLAFALGIASAIIIYFLQSPIFYLLGQGPKVDEVVWGEILIYFPTRLLGLPFSIFVTALIGIFRGLGKVKTSLKLGFYLTVGNILLSIFFIHILNLGIFGAALGTVLSFIFGTFWGLYELSRPGIISEWKWWPIKKLELNHILELSNKSWAMFGRTAALLSSFLIATGVASRMGRETLGAHQIVTQFWLVSSFFIDGVAISANILGAKLLGQKDNKGLKTLINVTLKAATYLGGLFCLIYLVFGRYLHTIFTNDSEVLALVQSVWPWIVWGQLINSFSFVFDGVLFGLNEFHFLKKMMIYGLVLVFIPIALLAFYYQNYHLIWIGMICLNIHRTIFCYLKVRKYT